MPNVYISGYDEIYRRVYSEEGSAGGVCVREDISYFVLSGV